MENLEAKSVGLRANLDNIMASGQAWAQTRSTGLGPSGYLPYMLISPIREYSEEQANPAVKKVGLYEYVDWRGQRLKNEGIALTTSDRFHESRDINKSKSELKLKPVSSRDSYLIFEDNRGDYFKNGLQILHDVNPFENGLTTDVKLSQFTETPYENTDPIVYGFDIVIDNLSSPLLNGSVDDFINNYSMISEIAARADVYQDFKKQFSKFFRTKTAMDTGMDTDGISNTNVLYPLQGGQNGTNDNNKKAYMSYYIKQISGLDALNEANSSQKDKFLVDYRKDLITLHYYEDTSLSFGALINLYKLLYWSRANGKAMIPDNLLRFNCDIIISECRNYNRVQKALDGSGSIDVIKDNVSRYIYSLRECQFHFDKPAHGDSVDLSIPLMPNQGNSFTFDYKYSSMKFEKFVPMASGGGGYVGYDNGAMWKIGNAGARQDRNISVPAFKTENIPTTSPYLDSYDNHTTVPVEIDPLDAMWYNQNNPGSIFNPSDEGNIGEAINIGMLGSAVEDNKPRLKNYIERLKDVTKSNVKMELAKLVNNRLSLMSRTFNKLANSFVGGKGVRPPKNVYHVSDNPYENFFNNVGQGFFYDVRNQLSDFTGDSLAHFLNNSRYR